MKHITYLFILLSAAVSFSSCVNDFLDTKSPSKQTDENAFSNVSYTHTVLSGIYGTLTEATVYGQKISTNWPTNSDIEFAGLSLNNYNALTRDSGASNFYAVSDNQNLKWDLIYKVVEQATTAVEGIRQSPQMETGNKRMMQAMLGEALTLRALAYFELVKHYGDVPYKGESSNADLSNVFVGKVDRDTVYAKIIEDLQEAQEYLPWQGKSVGSLSYSAADRVTKGFAKALMARAALFAGGWSVRDRNQFPETTAESHSGIQEMNGYFTGRPREWKEYYRIAARQCAEILGDPENPHALDPEFQHIWETVCQLQYNKHNENLFEVAFGLGNSGDIGNLIGMRVDGNTDYGTISLGAGNVVSTAYYFYSFDRADSRRDVTLTNISYSSENKEKFNSNPTDWKFAKWRIYWMTDGYLTLHKSATSGRVGTGINWIVMRYSDVLLMFAEAQNELAGPDAIHETAGMSARDALEAVRARAFYGNEAKVKGYTTDFFEAIVHERAWEFGGEALRKYDLIRWGLLSEKTEEQKVALCRMINGKGMITIFDKEYDASQFPTKVYYKYLDAPNQKYIDRSALNYYDEIADPGSPYSNSNWLSNDWGRSRDRAENFTKILVASTGLNASYDYSWLVPELDDFEYEEDHKTLGDILSQYPVGNKVCNYRHPFSIYYKNVADSRGALKNSYGY